MNTRLYKIILTIISFNLSSCTLFVTKQLYIAQKTAVYKSAPFTDVEKILLLKRDMSIEQVKSTLGIDPFDIFHLSEKNSVLISFTYRLKERRLKVSTLNLDEIERRTTDEASQTSGEVRYNKKKPQLIYVLFEDGLMVSFITTAGKSKSERILVRSNNLSVIEKKNITDYDVIEVVKKTTFIKTNDFVKDGVEHSQVSISRGNQMIESQESIKKPRIGKSVDFEGSNFVSPIITLAPSKIVKMILSSIKSTTKNEIKELSTDSVDITKEEEIIQKSDSTNVAPITEMKPSVLKEERIVLDSVLSTSKNEIEELVIDSIDRTEEEDVIQKIDSTNIVPITEMKPSMVKDERIVIDSVISTPKNEIEELSTDSMDITKEEEIIQKSDSTNVTPITEVKPSMVKEERMVVDSIISTPRNEIEELSTDSMDITKEEEVLQKSDSINTSPTDNLKSTIIRDEQSMIDSNLTPKVERKEKMNTSMSQPTKEKIKEEVNQNTSLKDDTIENTNIIDDEEEELIIDSKEVRFINPKE